MRKVSPVVFVGILLIIASFALYILNPPFIQAMTNYAFDAFLRSVRDNPKSGKVVIVDIDERSLEEVGQFPWSRYRIAKMSKSILDAGASVLAFDIVFAEKDRTSPKELTKTLNEDFDLNVQLGGIPENLMDFDLLLAETFKNRNVILGCFMVASNPDQKEVDMDADPYYQGRVNLVGKGDTSQFLLHAADMTISIPELTKVTETAYFNAQPDDDNIVRNNPLFYKYGDKRVYPSLALQAFRMHTKNSNCMVRYEEDGVKQVRVGKTLIPTDRHGRMWINYRRAKLISRTGFYSSFKTVFAVDVLNGNYKEEDFKDKIVLVGTSAVGLNDLKATPMCNNFPGVEVHATILDNILANDMLSYPTWIEYVHQASILFIGIFLTVFISKGKSWLSFLVSVGLCLAFVKTSTYMMGTHNLVFLPTWILFSVAIMYPTLTMIKFWQEEKQKRKVRGMFGTMVSQDVLHYLENNPESFSLSGQRAEATMFFSDVASFTTISEKLEPEKLSVLLNRYLSPMTEIIMSRRGYIDKYEGDLIMAEWGVPYAMEDHAVQGCLAALEQQKELREIRPKLKDEFGHDIIVRMGVNSGVVTAGNMGSDKKFQYTVMGDAVNQAARFEPVNKDYGTEIIIGESTYEAAKGEIEARLLDKLVVKGKEEPIQIYELVGKRGELTPDKSKILDLYVQALMMSWERKWDESIKCFEEILKLDPDDIPSVRMKERVRMYRERPPADGWAGEHIRTHKD